MSSLSRHKAWPVSSPDPRQPCSWWPRAGARTPASPRREREQAPARRPPRTPRPPTPAARSWSGLTPRAFLPRRPSRRPTRTSRSRSTPIAGNVGSTDLQQKFALFNQAGSGWPDAIFFPSNDDIAWATSAKINYARDLSVLAQGLPDGLHRRQQRAVQHRQHSPLRSATTRRRTSSGTTPSCSRTGATPRPRRGRSTRTCGIKIATEHPGYISGFLGDAYAPDRYLWASGCPTNDRLSETKVHINTSDPLCKRVVDLIDKMVAAKALSPVGIFDPNAAEVGPKLAMSPGAVWWGNYLFRDTWKIPAGQMTATAPIHWSGETPGFTGDEGGGLWGVSTHIKGKQLENTLTFAKFVTSDPRWQVELSTGLPAYTAPQQAWLDKGAKDGYFADYPTTAAAVSPPATPSAATTTTCSTTPAASGARP